MKVLRGLRTIISAAFLLTLVAVGGCTTAQDKAATVAAGSIDQTVNTLVDEKGYYALLKGEQFLNNAANNAVDLGVLKAGSPVAVKVADLLRKYTTVSQSAQRAKRLNDAVGVTAKIAEGKSLYAEILGLIGSK